MKRGRPDIVLVAVTVVLVLAGLVLILSASGPTAVDRYHDPFHFLKRQTFAALLGGVGCAALAMAPHGWVRRHAWTSYAIVLVGLVLVFAPGVGRHWNAASRWVGIGSFSFQPSEFARLALALVLARYLDRRIGRLNDWRVALVGLLVPLPLVALLLLEPDHGGAIILLALTLLAYYVAGLPTRWLAVLGGGAAALLVPLMLIAKYPVRRVRSFLDPWADPLNSGYQVIQSMIAFHLGGLDGRGPGESVAKHYFLPEAWTDFISAVVAEELGLWGVLALIALYGVLIWRGIAIARHARDLFSMVLATTLTALIGVQTVVNLGVAMGVLPNKGLVLPFVSFGGSALVADLLAVGLLLNLSAAGFRGQRATRGYRNPAMVEG